MPFKHDTGVYNVHASVAAWLQAQLTANQPPLVTGTLTLNLDYPEKPLAPPTASLSWLGGGGDMTDFPGGQLEDGKAGGWRWELCAIDLWVSRTATNFRAQLAQLVDAVKKALATLRGTGSGMVMYDFYTNASAPAALAYLVRYDWAEVRETAPDPNPDIARKRIVTRFSWVERNS